MNERSHDRLFAASGIASVALMLAGVGIGAAGGTSSSRRSRARRRRSPTRSRILPAPPSGSARISSCSASASSSRSPSGHARSSAAVCSAQIARAAATSYATLSVASLAVMDAIAYRSGHGMGLQLATTLITRERSALRRHLVPGRRSSCSPPGRSRCRGSPRLGWSAMAIAAITLVADRRLARQPRPDRTSPSGLPGSSARASAWPGGRNEQASRASVSATAPRS